MDKQTFSSPCKGRELLGAVLAWGQGMKRPLLLILAALAFSTPSHAADKVLTVGAAVFPDNLRAGNLTYAATSLVAQTNDFLVSRDDKGDILPALATRWEAIDPMASTSLPTMSCSPWAACSIRKPPTGRPRAST